MFDLQSGDWFLVAPVYNNATTRDGIYLPYGDWYDWWDGTTYNGPMTIDGYYAPLDKLPLFVRDVLDAVCFVYVYMPAIDRPLSLSL